MNSLVPRFGDGRDWWFERRYGMFVHWGLYAINGWHEQEQWRRRVPRSQYTKLAAQWNPTKFSPEAWLDLAQEAGMEYLCLTTKHHDGFCLWDTKLTRYNTMNTPYGKDIVKLLAEACQRRKFPLCLYYSIADWHHPSYPNQGRHHEIPAQPEDSPDLLAYTEFVRGQVRELCTHYGELHGFWWDMNVDLHRDTSINALIRQLQPKAVINDRGYDEGDFGTPERDYESKVDFMRRVEACQSVGMESWSWRKNEDYYTDRHLMRSIAKFRARDANYLLNVGPKGDGTIPVESAGILKRIGRWYKAVREAFEGTTPCSELAANKSVLLTRKANTLYVICHTDLVGSAIKLKPLAIAPARATLLNTGKPVAFSLEMTPSDHVEHQAFLRLTGLATNTLADTTPVIKLEFDHPLPALVTPRSNKPGDVLIR
ncbi:MAG: alpha-L-fucosidase [Armatimonadetes bacterium]|nr:alpha-L-fucosidase [Armatimonadota bacterium]